MRKHFWTPEGWALGRAPFKDGASIPPLGTTNFDRASIDRGFVVFVCWGSGSLPEVDYKNDTTYHLVSATKQNINAALHRRIGVLDKLNCLRQSCSAQVITALLCKNHLYANLYGKNSGMKVQIALDKAAPRCSD